MGCGGSRPTDIPAPPPKVEKVAEPLPPATAPPLHIGLANPGDGTVASPSDVVVNENGDDIAKVIAIEEPAPVDLTQDEEKEFQPEGEPDAEDPPEAEQSAKQQNPPRSPKVPESPKVKPDELSHVSQEASQAQEVSNAPTADGAQALYTGPKLTLQEGCLKVCSGGTLGKDGLTVINETSYQSAAAFTTEKIMSFSLQVKETRQFQAESMILGFTEVPIDEAIEKVSHDDCEAHDLPNSWMLTEKSVKMPTQLKLVDYDSKTPKKGDIVTVKNISGNFVVYLNGSQVLEIKDCLPNQPLTGCIQPRGIHSTVCVVEDPPIV